MANVWKKMQRADADFSGNVTGKLNNIAVATVTTNASTGASKPTTFRQDDVPTALNAGDIWFDTNDNNKQYRATATGDDAVTSGKWEAVHILKGGLGLVKGDVGLGNVTNHAAYHSGNKPTKSDVGLANVLNEEQIKTDGSNAPNILKNNQITLTADSGTVTLNNAGTGTIVKGDIGLSSVENKSSSDIRGEITKANVTDTGLAKGDVGLGNVANETPATLKTTMSLNNVTNESKSTMFASPTFTGTPAGITKTHVGLSAVTNDAQIKTDGSNAPNLLKNDQISLTATGGTVTLNNANTTNKTIVKGDIGLGSVVNQKIAINSTSKSLEIDDVAQDLNATKLAGDSSATIKAAAVSTAETNIVGASPGTLDTLTKIKAALNDDTSFSTTVTNSIATKQKAPMTITANDVANSSYDNDPTSEAQGQIGVYNGNLYQVVDV